MSRLGKVTRSGSIARAKVIQAKDENESAKQSKTRERHGPPGLVVLIAAIAAGGPASANSPRLRQRTRQGPASDCRGTRGNTGRGRDSESRRSATARYATPRIVRRSTRDRPASRGRST